MKEVYYRIYKNAIVTMQDFDEVDYKQEYFLTDNRYDTQEKAYYDLWRIQKLAQGLEF